MEQMVWILWIILGVALIVAEIFTLGFVLFWFGIGAFAAVLVSWLGFGFGWQFLIFAVVSIALTAMSRKIFANFYEHGDENSIKTGIATLPGQFGTVTAESRGALNEGAVKVFGSTWTAFPADDAELLVEGEKVEVVRVEGSSLYVRKMTERIPEWRKPDGNQGDF